LDRRLYLEQTLEAVCFVIARIAVRFVIARIAGR
jgi:hypothetical protein